MREETRVEFDSKSGISTARRASSRMHAQLHDSEIDTPDAQFRAEHGTDRASAGLAISDL